VRHALKTVAVMNCSFLLVVVALAIPAGLIQAQPQQPSRQLVFLNWSEYMDTELIATF
jgi:spermidine/putrescine-binding protein